MKTRVIQDGPEPNDGHVVRDTDGRPGERPLLVPNVVADPSTHDRREPTDTDSDGGH